MSNAQNGQDGSKVGRPRVGERIALRVPPAILARVDAMRGDAERSTYLRVLIQIGLAQVGAVDSMAASHARAARLLNEIADVIYDPIWAELLPAAGLSAEAAAGD